MSNLCLEKTSDHGDEYRGMKPMTHHIRDDQSHTIRAQRQVIVIIPANSLCRSAVTGSLNMLMRDLMARQQGLLNLGSQLDLLLDRCFATDRADLDVQTFPQPGAQDFEEFTSSVRILRK